jgi:hypothetical protein
VQLVFSAQKAVPRVLAVQRASTQQQDGLLVRSVLKEQRRFQAPIDASTQASSPKMEVLPLFRKWKTVTCHALFDSTGEVAVGEATVMIDIAADKGGSSRGRTGGHGRRGVTGAPRVR